jgi:hypothetical protein
MAVGLFGGLGGRLWSGFGVRSFVSFVVSDRTSGCSSQFAVTDRRTGNGADNGTLDAAFRIQGRRRCQRGDRQRHKPSLHVVLLF